MPTLYETTVPHLLRGLENLSTILTKAVAHTKEEGQTVTVQDLLDARLHPDMYGLAFQIQRVSDTAKNSFPRISNGAIESLSIEDNETTFEDLQARLTKTIEFVKAVKPEHLDGKDNLTIKPKMGPYEKEFVVRDYVSYYMIPNFWFHVSMAYAILRMKGVPVGKFDYLGHNLLQ